jgi:hypothetical protein
VVQYDRRKREIVDRDAVIAKFGVPPESIADYLALVGDTADGYPGLPGWGAKSAATVLAKFGSIDAIPDSSGDWGLPGLRSAEKLAVTLRDQRDLALLFRRIATVELDVEVGAVDDWRLAGPTPALEAMAERLGAPELWRRATSLAASSARWTARARQSHAPRRRAVLESRLSTSPSTTIKNTPLPLVFIL